MDLVRSYIKLSLSWSHLAAAAILAFAMVLEFFATRHPPDARNLTRLIWFFEFLIPMMTVMFCAGGWPREREERMLNLTNTFMRSPARSLGLRMLIQLGAMLLLSTLFMTVMHFLYSPLDWWVAARMLAPNILMLAGITVLTGVFSGSSVVALGFSSLYSAVDFFSGGTLVRNLTLVPIFFGRSPFDYTENRLLLLGAGLLLLSLSLLIVHRRYHPPNSDMD